METKTFAVSGMKCDMCKAKVEGALRSLNGVESAQVSLGEAHATVEYDEALVSPEQMKEAVDNLGRFELTV